MNTNWIAIKNEIETLKWVTNYLDLDDDKAFAVLIVSQMQECGSLAKAMDLALLTRAELDAEGCSGCEDEDEEEEG